VSNTPAAGWRRTPAGDRPMIRPEVLDELSGNDLEDALELVRVAWDFDEEAGFTRIPEELVRQKDGDRLTIRHVLVRGKLDDLTWNGEGGDLLAYLHLSVDGPDATGRLVVHPDHRSRGVSTLLAETLGLEIGPEGWLGSGARTVRGWALGHHPAAERLARRFGLQRLTRTWLQVLQLTGPLALPLPDAPMPEGIVADTVVGPFDATFMSEVDTLLGDSGLSEEERQQVVAGLVAGVGRVFLARVANGTAVGMVLLDDAIGTFETRRAGTVRSLAVAKRHEREGIGLSLLVSALGQLSDAGAEVALMRLDPSRDRAVRLVRRLGFERNQDDALYGFGDPEPARVLPE